MDKLAVEYCYYNEDERKFLEDKATYDIVVKLFKKIAEEDRFNSKKEKGDIFEKKIAFIIHKEKIPPFIDDNYIKIKDNTERLTLEQIPIQEVKYEPVRAYKPPKYNIKERFKILFKGKLY